MKSIFACQYMRRVILDQLQFLRRLLEGDLKDCTQ